MQKTRSLPFAIHADTDSEAEIEDGYTEWLRARLASSIEKLDNVEMLDLFPKRIAKSEIVPATRRLVFKQLPYVAFLRVLKTGNWEVIDIVHTSRKLPKNS